MEGKFLKVILEATTPSKHAFQQFVDVQSSCFEKKNQAICSFFPKCFRIRKTRMSLGDKNINESNTEVEMGKKSSDATFRNL